MSVARDQGSEVRDQGASLPVRSYRDLKVWQRAKALALLVYKITASFPADERFGLISQMRRSAVSIPLLSETAEIGRMLNGLSQSLKSKLA